MSVNDQNESRLYEILKELGITDYKVYEHKAFFSCVDADEEYYNLPGHNLKNLLVKEKKSDRYYMVIINDKDHMDQKHFKEVTGWGKIRFATEEEMWQLLKLKPGSVTPFALFNDVDRKITVVLGREIAEADKEDIVNFHPCRNTATLALKNADFIRYLKYIGCSVIVDKV